MSAVLSPSEAVLVPNTEEVLLRLLDEGFRSLAAAYPDLHLEQTAEGEIIVVPPPYTETGRQNFRVDQQFGLWMAQGGGGEAFDSSTIFRLPNGAKRSPDLSWIEASRWAALPSELKREFAQICPDFVLELRSETDRLPPLQRKMREYIANGARLGWLIDPRLKRVEIYRPEREVEVLDNPASVSGEDVLPGFILDLTPVWG
jgi:Uma2 family endonuclease